MKEYLEALILEQINRCLSLKRLIPQPFKYAELVPLADRCSRAIDENIERLGLLLHILRNERQDELKYAFRGFRDCAREIELIEYYGISALYYQSDEIGYLNKLVFKIHREINLPLTPPAVACISTKYYYFEPFTNVIFVPVGESDFLLHLPDLFHEIGHEVLNNMQNQPRLDAVRRSYRSAIIAITEYYRNLLARKKREKGPPEIPRVIAHIQSQWKDDWIKEFFADLFALFTLGPAYAWSHLHLTIKKTENVYTLCTILRQRHPSDDARMKMLICGLNILGYAKEDKAILSKWNDIPFTQSIEPIVEYQYAYPNELIQNVASILYNGISESGFSIVKPEALRKLGAESVVRLLNEAWDIFWKTPNDFRAWEEEEIKKVKAKMLRA